jgi:FKBP-type peptidyl-prolyl cis-trans isomerase
MDVFPLLLPLFVIPGADALAPVDVLTDGDVVAFDQAAGPGPAIAMGEVATLHYSLSQDGGKELADSLRRGLPFSVFVDGTVNASLVVDAVQGMRLGGTRVVLLPSSRLAPSDGPLLPREAELVLTLRLVAIGKPKGPKVDSNDAGRTQGAMEIP